jgi:hypothetical protein
MGETPLRGLGWPVAKSAELSPASTQPSSLLRIALVVLGAGAGAVSKQFADAP